MFDTNVDQDNGFAYLGIDGSPGSPLVRMLMAPWIEPGSAPGYELCKLIYSFHPLGPVLTDAPITLAQSQEREISVPMVGEKRLVAQFQREWTSISKVGATVVLHNLFKTSRIYGIASLAVGERNKNPAEPLDLATIDKSDLFFNVLDPLNTAGSLVLNQDPNSPDFLKPKAIYVAGQAYHPSRTHTKMNEQPLYIDWTSSAFGFSGRSVYQRALYPLKTFLQTMITDQMVTQKAGLLVAKMKSPGSFIDNVMRTMAAWKRGTIKSGVTGQVLQIGVEEDIETLNMQNLDKAAMFARDNVLKNIASATAMPATLIRNETLTEGFGEGSEDAKKEAHFLDWIRTDMQPAYEFMDRIVMRRAWTPEFYEALCDDYPEYKNLNYETALHEWMRAFTATWPNLLVEPDSEKSKTADVQFKAVIAMVETIGPLLDPDNAAELMSWAAENANEREELFGSKLNLDIDKLKAHLAEKAEQAAAAVVQPEEGEEPAKPKPFALAS